MAFQDGSGKWDNALAKAVRHLNTTLATLFAYAFVFVVALTATTYAMAPVDRGWAFFIGPMMGVFFLIFILPVIAIFIQIGALILSNFSSQEYTPLEVLAIVIAGLVAGGLPAYGVGFIFERGIVPFGLPGMIAGVASALVLRARRGGLREPIH